METSSLFTVPRYIPDFDFLDEIDNVESHVPKGKKKHSKKEKLSEKGSEKPGENFKKEKQKGGGVEWEEDENPDGETETDEMYKDYEPLNDGDLEESEQVWFNNLMSNVATEEPSIENSHESQSDDDIILNADTIFKNIYPFFKTQEDPNYYQEKIKLRKISKYKSKV
ncbi:conserved Plasmodium protein, unknown function [Plasmodium ovale]|nr:conserved Plasmodium protein, unknown function [Plasmodium ovale]